MVIEDEPDAWPDDEPPRVVRLPIVPRDTAIGEDRPLSNTARLHGGAFHSWLQQCIEASRPDGPGSAARAARPPRFSRLFLIAVALWRRLAAVFRSRPRTR